MTHQTFTVTDPRNFDGDPFDVASRSAAQLKGLLDIAAGLVPSTIIMARNAEMERSILAGGSPGAELWDESTQGRQWSKVQDELAALYKRVSVLQRASEFDPRKS